MKKNFTITAEDFNILFSDINKTNRKSKNMDSMNNNTMSNEHMQNTTLNSCRIQPFFLMILFIHF